MDIAELIIKADFAKTKTEARRMIEDGTIRFNRNTDKEVCVEDKFAQIFFIDQDWLLLEFADSGGSESRQKLTIVEKMK
jgi:tyrosyl-tRNA synthetase